MMTTTFWTQTFERAVKTFAQALVAVLTADQVGLMEVDWPGAFGLAGMAALVSVLTSIASAGVGDPTTPSAVEVGSPQSLRSSSKSHEKERW